jgi:7-carboxy-7-deazaguanine synthase
MDDKRIPVVEMFGPVYQGEGPLVGTKTWFLRTGGCDYRCPSCDSLHAVLPDQIKINATMMTQNQILDKLLSKMRHTDWLTISGGNPAMWDLEELVQALVPHNISVAVETQGSVWRPWIAVCDSIVVSPKGPGMGYGDTSDLVKFMQKLMQYPLESSVALKIPILTKGDIVFAMKVATLFPEIALFLSIGNHYPPQALTELEATEDSLTLQRNTILTWAAEVMDLVSNTPALKSAWIFPQQHVLVYGNERGR